jgi:hypothetical protein
VSDRDDEGRFDAEGWAEQQASREARIHHVSGWVAVLATIALFVFAWSNVYDWIMGRAAWFPVVLVGAFVGVALYRRWYDYRRHPVVQPWVLAGFFLVLALTARAYADASDFHVANCWHIEGTSRWECAPGSEPRQSLPGYNNFTDTETPGHVCDYVDTTSSGGTIWECHDE